MGDRTSGMVGTGTPQAGAPPVGASQAGARQAGAGDRAGAPSSPLAAETGSPTTGAAPARRAGAHPRRPGGERGQRNTRLAFLLIVLLVLAQVTWWLIFQEGYISEVTRERLAAWEADAATATALLATGAARADDLLARYPHLELEEGVLRVDDATRLAFVEQQRGHMRMFAFEAPVFVLAILVALVLIASTLRSERELKRRQQNFLSAVTHEFRTPVSTLRLLVETALMRPLSAERTRDYLHRMAAEVRRLERTSEQVLASARLEQAGPQAALLESLDLGTLVREIVDGLRQGLEARGARLDLRIDETPIPVSAERDAFALILSNLLDNAVKYTPAEVKPIRVIVESRDDLALLHVEDEGIGIGEGEEGRIFERFYRSGDEMTRESTGMGLGLHLVKSTVEAMNGWVRCGNREDARGARFTVVLPRRVTNARIQGPGVTPARSTT